MKTKKQQKLGDRENCHECGAPCTMSGIGLSAIDFESQLQDVTKERDELKERIAELETEPSQAAILAGRVSKELEKRKAAESLSVELLAALKAVTDQLNVYLDGDDSVTNDELKPSELAAIAIAKAEK